MIREVPADIGVRVVEAVADYIAHDVYGLWMEGRRSAGQRDWHSKQ
jgi:hypothetical protein